MNAIEAKNFEKSFNKEQINICIKYVSKVKPLKQQEHIFHIINKTKLDKNLVKKLNDEERKLFKLQMIETDKTIHKLIKTGCDANFAELFVYYIIQHIPQYSKESVHLKKPVQLDVLN